MASLTEKLPLIEILVTSHDGTEHLKRCLPSLVKITYPNIKVHVLVSGSRNESLKILNESFPFFDAFDMGDTISWPSANNLAIKKCTGEFVCFLNDDIEVTPGWLDDLIREFRDPRVAAAVPKMYDFQGRLNSTGGLCDHYGFAYNRGIGERDHGQYDTPSDIPYACTAAAVVRRSVFAETGYFDEAYFAYHDDVDFSWRLLLRGYKIRYSPRSVVYHKHMGTHMSKGRSRIIALWERNRVRTLLKNYEAKTLIAIFPTLFILKILHVTYAIVNHDASEVRAVISAYIWNLIHLKDTWRLRRRIKTIRLISDAEFEPLLFPQSIELRIGLGKIYHPIARRRKAGPGYMLAEG